MFFCFNKLCILGPLLEYSDPLWTSKCRFQRGQRSIMGEWVQWMGKRLDCKSVSSYNFRGTFQARGKEGKGERKGKWWKREEEMGQMGKVWKREFTLFSGGREGLAWIWKRKRRGSLGTIIWVKKERKGK